MNLTEYVDGARRTESAKSPLSEEVVALGLTNRMYHGIVGINTEIGEVALAYEKSTRVHGILDTDYVNVAEEIGDAYWYIAVLIDELGITEEALSSDGVHLDPLSPYETPDTLVVQATDMLDLTKKTMFYGKEYDKDVLFEQVVRFYVHLGLMIDGLKKELDVDIEKVWTINLDKLKIRYPAKFDMNDAEVRDLEAERVVLNTAKGA